MKDSHQKQIENFAGFLSKKKNVEAVYLFGSYLSNFGNLSDIDLCIIGNLNAKEKKEILRESPELFDVSFFNELPIYIKVRVFGGGKVIYLNERADIEELKYNTLREYRDFMFFMKNRFTERFKNA